MFNLQGSEIIFILLLALVVLGPEKLPGAIKRAMQTYAELRKLGTGFQDEFKSAIDAPMREMRETADLIKSQVDPKQIADDAERAAAAVAAADRADAELVAAGDRADQSDATESDADESDADESDADDVGAEDILDPFADPVDDFDDPTGGTDGSADAPDGTADGPVDDSDDPVGAADGTPVNAADGAVDDSVDDGTEVDLDDTADDAPEPVDHRIVPLDDGLSEPMEESA